MLGKMGRKLRKKQRSAKPPLSIAAIQTWAERYFERFGRWPRRNSGKVHEARGKKWSNVDAALIQGYQGLPGGSSLAKMFPQARYPALTIEQVLGWADAWYAKNGRWPSARQGAIPGTTETWSRVNFALRCGTRGLAGGTSLRQLLLKARGVRKRYKKPQLSIEQVLAWADAHHAATGRWPNQRSGLVAGTNDTTWCRINHALRLGIRGLPREFSLARLLARERGYQNPLDRPKLTEKQILKWARAHVAATGRRPSIHSGPIPGAAGETWLKIHAVLYYGVRGFPGGEGLSQFLKRHGIRAPGEMPLTVRAILARADAYHAATGTWPRATSPSDGPRGTSWQSINAALMFGRRGLPGGTSLAKLLARHRKVSIR